MVKLQFNQFDQFPMIELVSATGCNNPTPQPSPSAIAGSQSLPGVFPKSISHVPPEKSLLCQKNGGAKFHLRL